MSLINSGYQGDILRRFEAGEISLNKTFELLGKNKVKEVEEEIEDKTDDVEEVINQLDKMVGLENIKVIVKQLRAFVEIQNRRKEENLKYNSLVMHMIFKGNPGTGKTTVARLFGKFFKAIGLLEKGDLKEVERADLVGEYIGHTAQQTKKVIQEALGGVLFIDEAYALARGGERDFGKEAIDTLVKSMEDNKNNLIIILAGYPQEMESFLKSNPGLNSRFPIQIEFSDYTLDQLVQIAHLMLEDREYKLAVKAEAKLYSILAKIRQQSGQEEGNARTVRNIIERAIREQAVRLFKQRRSSKKDLMLIIKDDLNRLTENNA